MVNPVITWTSTEKMTLWDDCMSLPWLMVRVSRRTSISIAWTHGATGRAHHTANLTADVAELLQHEIDHLDGVLSLDRAEQVSDIVARSVRRVAKRSPAVSFPAPR